MSRLFKSTLLLYYLFPSLLPAQIFLNGSFEINEVDNCGINLNNIVFNMLVEHTIAFGDKNEVDVLTVDCGYGNARDGDFFLALNALQVEDAISLELEEALISGQRYAFSYAERAGLGTRGGVQIGLSDDPADFGVQIYSSEELSDLWTEKLVEFTAPIAGKFITFRPYRSSECWVFIDNFRKDCPKELSLGNDTILCELTDFRLEVEDVFEEYQWQDLSGAPFYEVTQPGLYWLTAMVNDCILSDTVLIETYPLNCNCQIYLPNAFSPNGDGINDTFIPQSPCPILDYELTIFNRWGAPVFHSTDPLQGWNGEFKGKRLQSGIYAYVLQYRFEYLEESQQSTGSITLLR